MLLSDTVHLGVAERDAITRAFAEVAFPLAEAWTELVANDVEITVTEVRPGPSPRPIDAEPDPTASILAEVDGPDVFSAIGSFGGELATNALIIPTSLGLVVVDLLLGGTGRPAGDRTLSAIDRELLTTMVGPTFAALRHLGAPNRVAGAVTVLTSLEEDEISARLASGVVVELTVTVAGHSQPLLVVLGPPAARHLSGAVAVSAVEAPAEESRAAIRALLTEVVIEAVVSFPPILVPSRTVLGLDVGDVVSLGTETDQSLPLRVDGRHLADVRPARVGNDVACQVVATAVDGPLSNNSGGSL